MKNSEGTNDGTELVTDNGTDHNGIDKSLSDEEKLIKAIKENPRITIVEVMNLLNKSRRMVARNASKSSKIVRARPDSAAIGRSRDDGIRQVSFSKSKRHQKFYHHYLAYFKEERANQEKVEFLNSALYSPAVIHFSNSGSFYKLDLR